MSPIELRTEEDRVGDSGTVPGVWVLVLFDMTFFGLLFLVYLQARSSDPELFDAAQAELAVPLGFVNMVVLLTSSWFIVRAIQAARCGDSKVVAHRLRLTFLCAAVFMIIKAVEYTLKFSSDVDLTNDYFVYYFILTGLHALHVISGMVVLAIMTRKADRDGYLPGSVEGLENGATFWHMVDLLWVFIFPVLYLAS